MTVAASASSLSVVRGAETFYFCSEGCKAEFEAREEHAPIAG
jgi:YHS domain-containing protein